MEDRYLGDGVYASYDGYHIILDLRGQKQPLQPLVKIALDQEVLQALDTYKEDVAAEQANKAYFEANPEAEDV